MKSFPLTALVFLLGLGLPAGAEEFTWSWDEKAGGSATAAAPARVSERIVPGVKETAAPAPAGDAFKWTWEETSAGTPTEKPPAKAVPSGEEAAATKKPLDMTAYNELLQENLQLREQVRKASTDSEAVRKENTRLSIEVADLVRRIEQFTRTIQELRQQKEAPSQDADKVKQLETQVTEAEREKAKLVGELSSLQKKIQELQAPREREPEQPAARPPSAQDLAVLPESDLFKKIEQENAALRDKLAAVEAEREKTAKEYGKIAERDAKAEARERELKEKLATVKTTEQETQRSSEQLLQQIPAMEQELKQLRNRVDQREADLKSKKGELETLSAELQRREIRLMKAQKVEALMERTKEEVRKASDKEKRDMHYNMASVYAREGRFKDAEREYLRAMQIDPSDADSHYNLAILYDDDLKDKGKAAMHYRRYLKLRPSALDKDQVKSWLLQLEME